MANSQISVKNLSKRFGKVSVLNNLNFEVEKGSIHGVIGQSGAGKTTLLRLLCLLESPTEGEILIAGRSLNTLNDRSRPIFRRKIGVVFQHYPLFTSRTILENILFPMEIAKEHILFARKRALELLQLVDLHNQSEQFPTQLSGGQKQRVAIARALAQNPELLLCDEPTSALDPATTNQILQLLQKVNQKLGITLVIITHHMDLVRQYCTDLSVMEKGAIVESGKVVDLCKTQIHPTTRKLLSGAFDE